MSKKVENDLKISTIIYRVMGFGIGGFVMILGIIMAFIAMKNRLGVENDKIFNIFLILEFTGFTLAVLGMILDFVRKTLKLNAEKNIKLRELELKILIEEINLRKNEYEEEK